MALLDELLQEAQHAYQAGKAGTGAPYKEYQFQIQHGIQEWQWSKSFLPEELATRDLFSELLQATIKATRLGELQQAEQFIQVLESLINKSNLSQDSRCFCQSFLAAAAAYLDYKYQRYDQAIARLRMALDIDEQVEQRNTRFAYLHLHRLMLLDNWIRALARQHAYRAALDLAFQVLDYLERKIAILDAPTSWDSSQLADYPADVLNILFRTVTAEIAELVTGKDALADASGTCTLQEVFARARHRSLPGTADTCSLSSASHDWLHLKQAALDKDVPALLQHAIPILFAGPASPPALWNAAIVEVVLLNPREFAHGNDTLTTFRAEVAQDIISWSRFPPAWKIMIAEAERSQHVRLVSAQTAFSHLHS